MGNVAGFTVKNWKNFKPVEDAFAYSRDGKTIVLADGITRDPLKMFVLPNFGNPLHAYQIFKFFRNYPNPSVARRVADLFCTSFLEDFNSGMGVKASFDDINKRISKHNENWLSAHRLKDTDYLEHDYPACVAVGLTEKDGVVSYGYIADCGFAIFDKSGEVVFRTPNEGPNSKGSIDEAVRNKYKTGFRFPQGRKIIRSLYRNNPSERLAYGALTGEIEAMHYVKCGSVKLGENILVVYTDGLEHVVHSGEFAQRIARGCDMDLLQKLCQQRVKTEGSLVLRKS
jgi:hypothetical protein